MGNKEQMMDGSCDVLVQKVRGHEARITILQAEMQRLQIRVKSLEADRHDKDQASTIVVEGDGRYDSCLPPGPAQSA